MTPLTVACVWVKGNVPYTVEYVTRLFGMVQRHLGRPARFVCLTDQPLAMPCSIEPIEIHSPSPLPGWWAKLQLFNRRCGLKGRVLYLDLDTLIVDALDPIVDFSAPFALVPHAGSFKPRNGLAIVPRFNSSVMAFDGGQFNRLWDGYNPSVSERLWGDQDWLGEQLTEAATMPAEWFPRLSAIKNGPMPEGARVVLAKKPKPAEAAQKYGWVGDVWRAA